MEVTELELFGRMRELMREEAELLSIPAEARTPEQHARLAEPDRGVAGAMKSEAALYLVGQWAEWQPDSRALS
jgi:hypothetical protein